MSRANPFQDLVNVIDVIAQKEAGNLAAQLRDLSMRLQYAEALNQEAARLLKHGPKGYGGPEKWMAARDAWLQRSGYGVK